MDVASLAFSFGGLQLRGFVRVHGALGVLGRLVDLAFLDEFRGRVVVSLGAAVAALAVDAALGLVLHAPLLSFASRDRTQAHGRGYVPRRSAFSGPGRSTNQALEACQCGPAQRWTSTVTWLSCGRSSRRA